MNDVTIKSLADIPAYEGPNAIPGIRFRSVRPALGITAWGMNALELDPHCEGYPEHDHTHDGQEELYLVLRGSIVLQESGREHTLRAGDVVRVPPSVRRKFVTRDEGATLLALGGTPGKAYTSSGM
jgi:uncharacterized cupin superfamily protein